MPISRDLDSELVQVVWLQWGRIWLVWVPESLCVASSISFLWCISFRKKVPRGAGGKRGGKGKGGEMTQTLYAHMNKIKIKKKEISISRSHQHAY
jgi:hypothetical protein